jgi:hypothetical protein
VDGRLIPQQLVGVVGSAVGEQAKIREIDVVCAVHGDASSDTRFNSLW